ncbi:MAG: diguanylate cyclase [Idiomarina sp.]|nr:diguanylate cyclase [Idiomarina sp.]
MANKNGNKKSPDNNRLEKIASISPGVIYQFERRPDGTAYFPYASDKLKDIYGVTPEEAFQDASSVFKVIHPSDLEYVASSILDSETHLTPWCCEYRVILNGEERWVRGHSIPEQTEDGTVIWSGLIMDITEQKEIEHELAVSKERLERAQRIAKLGYWRADFATGELEWSEIIFEIFGFDKRKTTPSVELFRSVVHPADLPTVLVHEEKARETGVYDIQHRIIRPDGEVRWVHELADFRGEAEGSNPVLFGTVRDITDQKRLEESLRELSITDSLTQLHNRRHVLNVMQGLIATAQRYDRGFSILMYDFDRFKHVNDTYGHSVGDEVLSRVSKLVRGELRQCDIVARLGGEEFVVVLPDTELMDALAVAEKLRQRISEIEFTSSSHDTFFITATFGVTAFELGDMHPDDLLKRADSLMYQGKQAGRNRVMVSQQNTIS